ncbi:MAG: thermopsin-like protease, partial [Pyrobaculum sp.]
PPPIVYPNGTRLEADPVSVFVDGPKAVRVNYTRVYYLVRVSGFNGAWELWAPRGGELELPAAVLNNGTRLIVREAMANGRPAAARIKVEEPLNITLRYGRQYLVKLIAPINSTEVWADEGSVFKVDLADTWEPGNGTLFKTLLVNGTAQREFRVDRPMTLRAEYAEVYYWAVVETPANKTAGWMPKGTVLKSPDYLDLGNGTRLAAPSVREVAVDRPVKVVVTYAKRQHYVKIEGVNRWEGWADAGSLIRLNATVVGGVEYTPAEVVTATGPGVYRPLFYAVYRTAVRDVLGVPNPLGTVKLCNAAAQAGLDGSAVVAAYTRELCQPTVEAFPISPYTAAGAAAVATVAVLGLKKRKK